MLTGCSEDKKGVTVSVEEGCDCGDILDEIKAYYAGEDITVVQKENIISDTDSTVCIGLQPLGESLDYGMWKSAPLGFEAACVISSADCRLSSELADMKTGIPRGFDYVKYVYLPENADVEIYDDTDVMLSDFKENVINAMIFTESEGVDIARELGDVRINTLLDGRRYEYVVISEDKKLIDSLNAVIE